MCIRKIFRLMARQCSKMWFHYDDLRGNGIIDGNYGLLDANDTVRLHLFMQTATLRFYITSINTKLATISDVRRRISMTHGCEGLVENL